MGTLRKWLFNLANGATLTGGGGGTTKDTTGTLTASQVTGSGSATSSTDHPYPGATSGKFVAASGGSIVARLPTDTANASLAFSVGFWYSGTAPTAATLNFYNGRQASGINVKLAISTAGKLILQDAAGTGQFTSAAALTTGFYRVDAYATFGASSTGTGRVQYCLDDTNTAVETSSALTAKNFGTANFAAADVGIVDTTASARTVYITSVQMEEGRTSFIGPYETGDPIMNMQNVRQAAIW